MEIIMKHLLICLVLFFSKLAVSNPDNILCTNNDNAVEIAILEICAKDGNVQSQLILGLRYRDGVNVDKDLKKSLYWINLASQNGWAAAEAELSFFYENGIVVDKNPEKAFELSERAAKKGSVVALNNLGRYYQKGFGVSRNLEKGISYYQKALEMDDWYGAKTSLGYAYFYGLGVPRDIDKALTLTHEAAKQGDSLAMANLGAFYKFLNRPEEAFLWSQKGADLDNSLAEANLGVHYAEGIGTPINKEKALYWLNKSMEQNQPQAFFIMGTLYSEGDKILQRDDKKAYELYLKAAKMDHGLAQNNLATWLFNGRFVQKDQKEALKWFLKAANENNVIVSMYALSQIYSKGTKDIPRDLEKSQYWFKKAEENRFVPTK